MSDVLVFCLIRESSVESFKLLHDLRSKFHNFVNRPNLGDIWVKLGLNEELRWDKFSRYDNELDKFFIKVNKILSLSP